MNDFLGVLKPFSDRNNKNRVHTTELNTVLENHQLELEHLFLNTLH
jgi:hypothetical protein